MLDQVHDSTKIEDTVSQIEKDNVELELSKSENILLIMNMYSDHVYGR